MASQSLIYPLYWREGFSFDHFDISFSTTSHPMTFLQHHLVRRFSSIWGIWFAMACFIVTTMIYLLSHVGQEMNQHYVSSLPIRALKKSLRQSRLNRTTIAMAISLESDILLREKALGHIYRTRLFPNALVVGATSNPFGSFPNFRIKRFTEIYDLLKIKTIPPNFENQKLLRFLTLYYLSLKFPTATFYVVDNLEYYETYYGYIVRRKNSAIVRKYMKSSGIGGDFTFRCPSRIQNITSTFYFPTILGSRYLTKISERN